MPLNMSELQAKYKHRSLYHQEEFWECPSCIMKPGSPTLCTSCLHNRAMIEDLERQVKQRQGIVEGLLLKLKTIRNVLDL